MTETVWLALIAAVAGILAPIAAALVGILVKLGKNTEVTKEAQKTTEQTKEIVKAISADAGIPPLPDESKSKSPGVPS